MNVIELASHIFGEGETGFVVFDDVEDRTITDLTLDLDQLIMDMPDGRLDFELDGEVFAVASDTLPLEFATLVHTKGDKVFGIYVLDVPVSADKVDQDVFSLDIPVGLGWSYALGDNSPLHLFEDLVSRVSAVPDDVLADTQSEGGDDVTDDVYTQVPLEDSVVADEEGESESPEEDSEPELTEIQMMNDAELLGESTEEMQELLNKPFVCMTGNMYGQHDRRNTQDKDWQRSDMPLLAWLVGADKGKNTWGLSRHPESKTKEGASIVFADAIGGSRKDAAIETMSSIGLDVDSGASLDVVIEKLKKLGLFAIVYTSHSHGKTKLELKHDDIMRKMKLDATPNRAQVQQYMREHHKDRYDEPFIDSIKVIEFRKQTAEGLRVIIETPPLDKFRVILPLAVPVKLSDLAPTVTGWKEVWADAVTGVAVNMIDVSFDSTSCDVNRLFFTPRHPPGAEWYSAIIQGTPLRFEDIEPYSKATYVKTRGAGEDPFMEGTGGNGADDRDTFYSPKGLNLNRWHTKHKERFMMADVIESFCQDKLRKAGGEKVGSVHLECPFEHEHTTEGGTATMAMNPDANSEHGYWTMFCKHDACQGRDKLEFLKQMLDDAWFDETLLRDDEWNMGEADSPEDVVEEEAGPKTPEQEAAEFTNDSTEAKIRKFIKRHFKLGADLTTQGAINDVLSTQTRLNKTQLRKMWADVRNDHARRQREEAAENNQDTDAIPVVNQWDFSEMVSWGNKRIQDANAERPRLFHYIDDVARIEETADRLPRIRMLTEKQFSAEMNQFTKWHHISAMGDIERRRAVSIPTEVVSQLFSSAHTVYPKLRGLVTTPTFTRDGALITTPGYHESGLFYWNDGVLDVPQVPDVPTEEDVAKAKRLLVEEVFADFPLGGLTRDEIVETALNPASAGVPALTNATAMLLLMFCRDMVDGPTPGHLLTKPSPGTGASLLTDVCSIIANGEVTAAMSIPTNKEEMSKTLLTILSDGSNIIYFDNIGDSVDSGELASALTSPKYKGRQLGKTQSIETEVRAVWVLCGNNVRLSPELVRRLVMVDLNANISSPESRTGWRHGDIRGWIADNRGELVWACLTLIQNWVANGMEGDSSVVLNSYENWSRVMGGILRDAGMGGFLANRDELKERASDGGEDDITLFLDAWWTTFIDKPVLMRSADQSEPDLIQMAIQGDLQLPLRLKRSVDDEPTYDPRNFGKFLGTYEGRVMALSDGTEAQVLRGKRGKSGYYWYLKVTQQAPESNVDL